MQKIIISALLSVFLGPGVGHLYLKHFKKAIALISASIGLLVLLAWVFIRSIDAAAWNVIMSITQQDLMTKELTKLFQSFMDSHSGFMFYYDLAFACLWAYAIVDGFLKARALMPPKENDGPSSLM